MTVNGVAYELPTWEHHTEDSESLSLLLTPVGYGPTLADEIEHLLPTPTVGMMMGGSMTRSGARSHELLLPGLAISLLPTPRASEGKHGGPNMRGSKGDLMLSSAVTQIGALTNPQSADGNKLWEDVPLPPPNPQDATDPTDSAPVSASG